MPARSIRSLPFRLSCPGLPHVEIVSAPTSSHELNSWSVVRRRMGAVRSRLGVACLQPMPNDHVVEDRRRGDWFDHDRHGPRAAGVNLRWMTASSPAGVTPRDVVTTAIAGPEPARPLDPPLAGRRLRHRVGAASFVRRVTVSCSPRLPVLVWRNTSAPGAKLTVEEVDLGAASRVRSSRRLDEINPLASPAPKPTDVTCSSIST
jgi:hypothetical protein